MKTHTVSAACFVFGTLLGWLVAGVSVKADYERKLLDQQPMADQLVREGVLVRVGEDIYLNAARPTSGKTPADFK